MKDQTVFVTGASSGIGRACAIGFAKLGYNLVITARRKDRLEVLERELISKYGIKCLSIQLDVQNNEEVEDVFKKLGMEKVEINILINNAGLALSTDKIQDAKTINWDTMIDTNVKGLLYVTKAALAGMLKKDYGHIINIGSVAGRGCYTGGNVYCATKYAVKAISKSLRMDLFGTAIRVSEVVPAATETEFSEVRFDSNKENAKKIYEGFEPLKAEDIADAVIYCATRPLHVNVAELVVYPQAQSSLTDIYKKIN